MSNGFGFSADDDGSEEPRNNLPNFDAIMAQFANIGISPQAFYSAGGANTPLIATQTIREVARRFLATHPETYVGTDDSKLVTQALDIANTWLDATILFPNTTQTVQPAWNRKDWMDSTISGWQKLVEPLAEGMASALTNVIADATGDIGNSETGVAELRDALSGMGLPEGLTSQPEFLQGITNLLRAFMGSMIATQLGQSVGALATTVTGSHDVAIPLFAKIESHLLPQNILQWSDGLEIPESEVRIYLALREAAAARLFSHVPWLTQYIRDSFAAYGTGIRVDLKSMQDQAERAMSSGELDISNPDSITSAISQGLFTPEESPAQEQALAKLEMILALIEGWIDHVVSVSARDRIPSLDKLNETLRRRRASNSPTQQLFANLLGLEVSPRKMRECVQFWAEVLALTSVEERDGRWEDPALLPTSKDLGDTGAFLKSTTVPDDLSGLI